MSTTAVLSSLSGILHELILPPSSLFLLMAIGVVMRRRFPAGGRLLTVGAVLALFVVSTVAGARLFVTPLERLTAPLRSVHNSGAQAIVVLAAGRLRQAPEYDGNDIPDYIALARLRYAARLQRATGLPVLVTGSNGAPEEQSWSKAEAMAAALREDFGVPVKWVETRSRNTAENAAFSAAMLRPEKVHTVLLVTDAMHMPRSRTAFQRAGLDVVAAPTMFFSDAPLGAGSWLPSAEGLRESWYAVYELIGIAWYRLRYQDAAVSAD